MRKLLLLLITLLCVSTGHAAPPSDESVNRLLTTIKAERTIDSAMANMENYLRQVVPTMPKAKQLTPDQLGAIDTMMVKMVKLMREEMSWEKMRPIYVQIYQESLSQEEVDGMIAFYQSPAGAAFIEKMPIIMQKSIQYTQAKMKPIMEKMEPLMDETIAQMKADSKKK